jgi:mono/diheme cytochrome c family protein
MRWLLVAAVCGMFSDAPAGQNASYHQDPAWRAPADAVSRPNPLARKPEAAAGGEKLFKRNCIECHGEDGSGLAKKKRCRSPAAGSPDPDRRNTFLEDYEWQYRSRYAVV